MASSIPAWVLRGGITLPAAFTTKADTGSCGSNNIKPTVTKRRRLPSLGAAWSAVKRRAVGATPQVRQAVDEESAIEIVEPLSLSVLEHGPYSQIASWLDAPELARTDATCRLLCTLNEQPFGPWQSIGDKAFFGMELDVRGGFFPFKGEGGLKTQSELSCRSWKGRYKLFATDVPTFSGPFSGREISNVERPDEVAYLRCRLRTDHLKARADCGIFVEVEIRANADNLSIAVVDFEGGGRSSVTFSPETGAVLRERKVREAPRAIEGTYIHLLPAAPQGHRFEGLMGIYLQNGQLSFFRKWAVAPEAAEEAEQAVGVQADAADLQPKWETTGFCTDLDWASGDRLSLCLAFRDPGQYHARIARVCRSPPIPPHKSEAAYQGRQWNHLYGDDDHPLAI